MKKIINYGDNRTIHGTTYLHVETDNHGNVVAVWFRCRALPFEQVKTDCIRAGEMKEMYKNMYNQEILAIKLRVDIPKSINKKPRVL